MAKQPTIAIRAALAGNQYDKTFNPNMPFGEDALVHDAVACVKAGASELHIHLRDAETGRPVFQAKRYEKLKERIFKELRKAFPGEPDMWRPVISYTTTQVGISDDFVYQRFGEPKPDEDPANFARLRGRMVFAKPDFVPITDPSVKVLDKNVDKAPYARAIKQARSLIEFAVDHDVKPECEIQHPYFTDLVEDLLHKGALTSAPSIQTLFGNPRNMPIENMEATVDDINTRLNPKNLIIGVRFPATSDHSLLAPDERRGIIKPAELDKALDLTKAQRADGKQKITGIRVGLEDNFSIEGKDPSEVTNASMVEMVAKMAKDKDIHIMTPAEARRFHGIEHTQDMASISASSGATGHATRALAGSGRRSSVTLNSIQDEDPSGGIGGGRRHRGTISR